MTRPSRYLVESPDSGRFAYRSTAPAAVRAADAMIADGSRRVNVHLLDAPGVAPCERTFTGWRYMTQSYWRSLRAAVARSEA